MIQISTVINAHNVTYESVFQTDIISQMQAQGWKLGRSAHYQRETALYEQDVLVYSPHIKANSDSIDTKVAKRNRIDIVLFINGLPVVTMELKSEFKQSVDSIAPSVSINVRACQKNLMLKEKNRY